MVASAHDLVLRAEVNDYTMRAGRTIHAIEKRGFRPIGDGRHAPCPLGCGRKISHGLPGNPWRRRVQPCEGERWLAYLRELASEREARAAKREAKRS